MVLAGTREALPRSTFFPPALAAGTDLRGRTKSPFPCDNHQMNWRTAAHFILETLGYAVGFRLYLRARRAQGSRRESNQRGP